MSCIIRNHASAEDVFFEQSAAVVLSKAFRCGYPPLLSRALFLSSALITSDYASNARISGIIGSTLPVLLGMIRDKGNEIFASLDSTEKVLEYLLVVVTTEHGFQMLTNDRSAADELVVALQPYFQEENTVKEGLLKLSRLLKCTTATVLYPASKQTIQGDASQSDQSTRESRLSSDSSSPMLLMPPPPQGGVR